MRSILKSFLAGAVALGLFSIPTMANSDIDSWKKAVVKSVVKKQKYPRAALAREMEGKAKVRLTVLADGTITNHEVIEATGEAILDREIPRLMKRLSPLPSLPDGREEVSFVLPLDWSLN